MAKAEYNGIKVEVSDRLPLDSWMLISVVAGRICIASPNWVQFFQRDPPTERATKHNINR